MNTLRKRLTYANVVSTIALFAVLAGGSAVAAGLANNSVGTKQLKNNAVTAKKIKKSSVAAKHLKAGSVGTKHLRADSVATQHLVDGTIGLADISGTAQTALKAPGGNAGGDLAGSFPNPTIAANAVNSSKVANDSLTGDDINESTLGTVPNSNQLGGRGLARVLNEAGIVSTSTDATLPAGPTFTTVMQTSLFGAGAGPFDGLVTATLSLQGNGAVGSQAICKLQASPAGGVVFSDISQSYPVAFLGGIAGEPATVTLTGSLNNASSGNYLVRARCTRTDGTVEFVDGDMWTLTVPE